ncbi:zinc/manganese transport system permease protein [Amycolatopsis bartoniae]|uniref:Helicase n=1 Tax=Amycolatopsis bartoniae TaxID=941986 RepID=A0A8H9MFS9_9PSEU|nr:metal ABC transporter permease [Amycolatopsis bartoniae]MBB2935110.1 zinc/manganese transport system permease protein [Amycolatopsis bartoniae]TVT06990.1 metal ABC transporter permease [Amycolatopsis bartoniae]GHF74424.1 helicase [Amycolatopsis bartoniae]
MDRLFDFGLTAQLLGQPFVLTALLAAAVLGLVAGVLGPLVVTRRMSFAVHGTAELAFTGAAGALLLGIGVEYGALAGSVLAALLLGLLGGRESERDSVIGVILSFGLGLGVLLLTFYPGRTSNKFGILIGQIVSIDTTNIVVLVAAAVVVLLVLGAIYRPLLFASVDPHVAAARGVPARLLSVVFAVLVGIATALGVQIVGSLLVVSLMVTPAAAAVRVTASPWRATVLAVVFAEVAAVGGIILSLAPGVPVSAFVTAISFLIYLTCRVVAHRRSRAGKVTAPDLAPAPTAVGQ